MSVSPKDWTHWLAMATAVHNNRRNEITKLSPNQILLGYELTLQPEENALFNNEAVETRVQNMKEKRAHDTILTPFSLSPMTDTAVDSLPELFLAYCTLADSNDIMTNDDRAVPRGSGEDPVPLLNSCALGLSSTFLSRSRR
jgi:hypothetical protein